VADFEDYYEILQVSHSAEPEVIEAAYKKLAGKYHPDVGVDKSPSATEKMKKINIAHDILSNPDKRREYDKEWQKHKVGDTRPGGAYHSKTAQNNTHAGEPKEDRGKPQTRVGERILIIALLIADIVLSIIFLLVPWIRQAIAHYPWLKVTLLLLILVFAGSAIGFRRFRRVLTNAIKSLFRATRNWVTGGDPDKAQRDHIFIIILSIIFIALLVLFLLIPWIRIILARYTWLKVLVWVLVAIFVVGLFKSQSFQRDFYDRIISIRDKLNHLIRPNDKDLYEILCAFKPDRDTNEHANNHLLCIYLRSRGLNAEEDFILPNEKQRADIMVDNNTIIEAKSALVARGILYGLIGQLRGYEAIIAPNGQHYDIYVVIYGNAKSDFEKQLRRETHSPVVILGKTL
jgi:curved DNA-binding protein CbpA